MTGFVEVKWHNLSIKTNMAVTVLKLLIAVTILLMQIVRGPTCHEATCSLQHSVGNHCHLGLQGEAHNECRHHHSHEHEEHSKPPTVSSATKATENSPVSIVIPSSDELVHSPSVANLVDVNDNCWDSWRVPVTAIRASLPIHKLNLYQLDSFPSQLDQFALRQ